MMKALASPLRAQILGLLARGPLSYTEIMRSLGLSPDRDAGKFAYHLKTLVRTGLIRPNSEDGKYEITDLGRLAYGILKGLEERLSPRKRRMVVRTSRLAMEEFDRTRIAEALMREAGVPAELASRIAKEAEERLVMARVRYLTAPLIREFVNAILLEKGLEEYRHKMTRLGLPVYDVSKLLTSSPSWAVKAAACGKVLEEYALIGVLHRDVADGHLSGALHLEDLRHWTLGPSAIYHDLRPVLASGPAPAWAWACAPVKAPGELEDALLNAKLLVMACSREVGHEQVLPFLNLFLAPFAEGRNEEAIEKAVKRFLLELAGMGALDGGQRTTLGIVLTPPPDLEGLELPGPGGKLKAVEEVEEAAKLLAKAVLRSFMALKLATPSLGLVVSLDPRSTDEELLDLACELAEQLGLPVFSANHVPEARALDGSCHLPDWTGDWELDLLRTGRVGRVVLNLPRLAYKAGGRRGLEELLHSLRELVEMAIRASAQRRGLLSERARHKLMPALMAELNGDAYLRLRNASFPIAFVGLPEACLALTGELPHEGSDGLEAAMRILDTLSSLLVSSWGKLDLRCPLSAVCDAGVAERLARLDVERYGWAKVKVLTSRERPVYTTSRLVPESADVSREELLELEAKMHKRASGGHLLFLTPDEVPATGEELADLVLMALGKGVRALAFASELTYCSACRQAFRDQHPKCPACGRVSTITRLERTLHGYAWRPRGGERAW
ncbi:hypothetical protein DRO60_05885 [Candidatus Bathyarchaeota archaeon]|nr:MAG: hypothetical protein DRO60_05885 [Candidatus Bathyarchaeota archaeon]